MEEERLISKDLLLETFEKAISNKRLKRELKEHIQNVLNELKHDN
jgi:hypothetical protein